LTPGGLADEVWFWLGPGDPVRVEPEFGDPVARRADLQPAHRKVSEWPRIFRYLFCHETGFSTRSVVKVTLSYTGVRRSPRVAGGNRGSGYEQRDGGRAIRRRFGHGDGA